MIQIISIRISDNIRLYNDLSAAILKAIDDNQIEIQSNDIVLVTHKIVSKAEGRIVDLARVKPSTKAIRMANWRI